MELKNVLSLFLLLTFGISYLLKLFILQKKDRILANVLDKSNKDKRTQAVERFLRLTTFIWIIVWLMQVFLEKALNKLQILWKDNFYTEYTGLSVIAIGISVFITAMVHMKTSWRVGIDKGTKTKLITYGIYRYSRNPAFVGFDLMFIGLFLMCPNILVLVIMLANLISFHLLILQEEKHLTLAFKDDYTYYKQKTPRYISFL